MTKKQYAVHHEGDLMDRTWMNQSFYFKIFEPSNRYSVTYFKVELSFDFIHVFRKGIGSQFGYNQEMKSQRMGFKLEMKNCIQNVKDRQPTPFANFICMQENRKFINDNMDSIIANRLIHEFIRRQDATFFNKW